MTNNRYQTSTTLQTNKSVVHQKLSDKTAKNENKLGVFVIILLVSALIYAAVSHG